MSLLLPFTLQQLRIIKAVATEQSFKGAADMLFVSQPSLSKQIKILENRLGVLLFDRKNRKVTLTEPGKVRDGVKHVIFSELTKFAMDIDVIKLLSVNEHFKELILRNDVPYIDNFKPPAM